MGGELYATYNKKNFWGNDPCHMCLRVYRARDFGFATFRRSAGSSTWLALSSPSNTCTARRSSSETSSLRLPQKGTQRKPGRDGGTRQSPEENLLLNDKGHVKLTDMGLAKVPFLSPLQTQRPAPSLIPSLPRWCPGRPSQLAALRPPGCQDPPPPCPRLGGPGGPR